MIELRDVTMGYGPGPAEPVLRDIDLEVGRGELVLLCGESGCGKTSLLRLLNGVARSFFDARISGEVLLDGQSIIHAEAQDIAQTIGSVFQNPKSQFFTLDVISELAFGCENLGVEPAEIERRIAQVTREFGMEDLLPRQLMQLSGGEKQKVACAAVAAMRPEVLLLDEPSSNLDMGAIAGLREIVARWKRQGRTVLVAEHRLYYLADLLDRAVYLDHGRTAREFTGDEFRGLDDCELRGLGLRSTSLLPALTEGSGGVHNQIDMQGFGTDTEADLGEMTMESFAFRYPKTDRLALDIDHLALPRGRVIGVVGRNGAGKSTFVRSLTGLEPRSKGMLRLGSADPAAADPVGTELSRPRQRLRRSFLVMQDVNHQLFGESVDADVAIGADRLDGRQTASAAEVLASLNLDAVRDRHPMSLSGGERQRVAIASALVCGREVIVFDEPTSGLDLRHMQQVARQLEGLARRDRAVLVVTHDVELLAECCDFLLVIDAGQVAMARPCEGAVLRRTVEFLTGSRPWRAPV